ncbi:predicted protein [Postia placenta Mad-698-R]|nr:predicted protein [Postia placenta Mad-698-R]
MAPAFAMQMCPNCETDVPIDTSPLSSSTLDCMTASCPVELRTISPEVNERVLLCKLNMLSADESVIIMMVNSSDGPPNTHVGCHIVPGYEWADTDQQGMMEDNAAIVTETGIGVGNATETATETETGIENAGAIAVATEIATATATATEIVYAVVIVKADARRTETSQHEDESELSLRDVPNGVMGDVLSGDFASLRGRGKGAAVAGETRFR